MINTKQMTVQEIKQYITEKHIVAKDVIENIKGKSNLVNFLESLEKVENSDDEAELEDIMGDPIVELTEVLESEDLGFEFKPILVETSKTTPCLENKVEAKKTPNMTDPEWTEYVLSFLSDKEKDKDYPKADGLRRLVEKFVGQIIGIETTVIQPPQKDNYQTSTVKTRVRVRPHGVDMQIPDPYKYDLIYDACTDVQKEHMDPPYDRHISAVAETRAEGRAYRKILKLQNVVTKEEMVSTDHNDVERINKVQIAFLDAMCNNSRLNINVKKLFEYVFKDQKLENITDYKYNQATELGNLLSSYQDDMNKIPTEIRGYDSSWRD